VKIEQLLRLVRASATFVANPLDRELGEDLAAHLQLPVDEFRRSGLSEAAARRAAVRKLRRVDITRLVRCEVRSLTFLELLNQSPRGRGYRGRGQLHSAACLRG
jgi:hypothetical protein